MSLHKAVNCLILLYMLITQLSTTLDIVIRNTPNLNADNTHNIDIELKIVIDWLKLNKLSLNLKNIQIHDISYPH